MAEAKLYNKVGEKIGEVKLNPQIFEVPVKAAVVKQVVVAQLANARQVIADTKQRGEVRGGGKKPWKQKGTGRARQGSIRSPLWKGGGVVFGPTTDRNFTQKVNKKVKKLALFMALSEKATDSGINVIEAIENPEGKTKNVANILKKMGVSKKALVVLSEADSTLVRSVRNIAGVEVVLANSLNILDVLKNKTILFTSDSLQKVEAVYLSNK